jgi:two-component system OmpR family response regulator
MQSAKATARRVLIAEDDPSVLELVVTRLSLAGYVTFPARDGQETIRRLFEIAPAALVLDINMPKADGFEVLSHMRDRGMTRSIGVMVLTARNRPDDVRKAISLGARDFLAKPFKDAQLLSRVARLVRQPRPNEATRQR